MRNKDDRVNELSDIIGKLDDDILKEAFITDTPEKLNKLSIKNSGRRRFNLNSAFRNIAVACTCVLISAGLIFTLPGLFKSENGNETVNFPSNSSDNPQSAAEFPPIADMVGGKVRLNSLDMLNYYSALMLISGGNAKSEPQLNVNAGYFKKLGSTDTDYGTEYPEESVNAPTSQESNGQGETIPSIPPEDIISYEFDPEQVFTITRVIYFKVDIKDEKGFLASKLGTGVAEVVITENSLDNMITFRNAIGDRYYSCLINGFSWDGSSIETMEFSTHKYIQGFYVVKNFNTENYRFDVELKNGLVYKISCSRNFGEGSTLNPGYCPDVLEWIPESSFSSNVEGSFTLAELEAYYSTVWETELAGRESDADFPVESSSENSDKIKEQMRTDIGCSGEKNMLTFYKVTEEMSRQRIIFVC